MDTTQSPYFEPLNTLSEPSLESVRPSTPKSTALSAREDYSPAQASPLSLSRPHSATAASSTHTPSPVRPGSAASRRPSSASGRKLTSSAGSDGALSPVASPILALRTDAFLRSSMSPSSRGGSPQMSTAKLKLHVQSLAANRSKEQLAEDLYSMQQSLKSAATREKKLNTERLRLDAELRKTIADTPKAGTYDPHTTSRSSTAIVAVKEKEASVVASLKESNRQLRAARDDLTEELSTLQRSTRATKASELEAEARMYLEEMDRQKKLAGQYAERVRELEESLSRAQMEITFKRTASTKRDSAGLTKIYNPDGTVASASGKVDNDAAPRSLRQELQMATIQAGRGLTGGSKELRAALASMQSAHRLLVAEAAALRQFLPEGCSWSDLDPKRWKQAGVSPRGASAILRFLRTHEVRLHNELAGLPGAKRSNKDVKPPPELNGPDYYVMEKDLQKAVHDTQRAKQDVTRMSKEMRAAKEWKAEAQRLREQMDTHMQGLTDMVESEMSASARKLGSSDHWQNETYASEEFVAKSDIESRGLGSLFGNGVAANVKIGDLGFKVDDQVGEDMRGLDAKDTPRMQMDAEAAREAAAAALAAADAMQAADFAREAAANVNFEEEEEEGEEEGQSAEEEVQSIDEEKGKGAAEPLEAEGASTSSQAPASLAAENSVGRESSVREVSVDGDEEEEEREEGAEEWDSEEDFARMAHDAVGDSEEEDEEDVNESRGEIDAGDVGDEAEEVVSVASSGTRQMAEAMLKGAEGGSHVVGENRLPQAVELAESDRGSLPPDIHDADDSGSTSASDSRSTARRSRTGSFAGQSASRSKDSLESSFASEEGDIPAGSNVSESEAEPAEPSVAGQSIRSVPRSARSSASGSLAAEKSQRSVSRSARPSVSGSLAAEESKRSVPRSTRSSASGSTVGAEKSERSGTRSARPSASGSLAPEQSERSVPRSRPWSPSGPAASEHSVQSLARSIRPSRSGSRAEEHSERSVPRSARSSVDGSLAPERSVPRSTRPSADGSLAGGQSLERSVTQSARPSVDDGSLAGGQSERSVPRSTRSSPSGSQLPAEQSEHSAPRSARTSTSGSQLPAEQSKQSAPRSSSPSADGSLSGGHSEGVSLRSARPSASGSAASASFKNPPPIRTQSREESGEIQTADEPAEEGGGSGGKDAESEDGWMEESLADEGSLPEQMPFEDDLSVEESEDSDDFTHSSSRDDSF